MDFRTMMTLEPHGADTFVATGPRYPWGGLYGGQIVAQALRATTLTVEPAYVLHSLHAYFIRLGDAGEPIRLEVDRVRNQLFTRTTTYTCTLTATTTNPTLGASTINSSYIRNGHLTTVSIEMTSTTETLPEVVVLTETGREYQSVVRPPRPVGPDEVSAAAAALGALRGHELGDAIAVPQVDGPPQVTALVGLTMAAISTALDRGREIYVGGASRMVEYVGGPRQAAPGAGPAWKSAHSRP